MGSEDGDVSGRNMESNSHFSSEQKSIKPATDSISEHGNVQVKQQQMVFSPNQQGPNLSQSDLDQLNQQYLGKLSQEDINQLKEQPFIINPYYQGPYPPAAYEQPSNSKKSSSKHKRKKRHRKRKRH